MIGGLVQVFNRLERVAGIFAELTWVISAGCGAVRVFS